MFLVLLLKKKMEIFIAALSDQNHLFLSYLPRRIVPEIWFDKADRRSSQMSKDINVFWTNIAEENWSVQDFAITPDQKAEWASYWCPFQRGVLKAHLPGLMMKGTFQVFLADKHTKDQQKHTNFICQKIIKKFRLISKLNLG